MGEGVGEKAKTSELLLRALAPMTVREPSKEPGLLANLPLNGAGMTATMGMEHGGGRQLSDALLAMGDGGTGISQPLTCRVLLKKASLLFDGAGPVTSRDSFGAALDGMLFVVKSDDLVLLCVPHAVCPSLFLAISH